MKNKKILMTCLVIAVIIAIFAVSISPVIAVKNPTDFTADDFDDAGANSIVGKILGFVQWVGSALAVIMLVALGIQYMVGSAEQKAEYKKSMIPYIVGAILIFAASNIAGWVYTAIANA